MVIRFPDGSALGASSCAGVVPDPASSGALLRNMKSYFPVVRGHLAPLGLEIFLFAAAAAWALFLRFINLDKSCAFAHIVFRFFANFVNL